MPIVNPGILTAQITKWRDRLAAETDRYVRDAIVHAIESMERELTAGDAPAPAAPSSSPAGGRYHRN